MSFRYAFAGRATAISLAIAALAWASPSASAADDAGHAIADRFSGAAEAKAAAEEKARSEAEMRRQADAKAREVERRRLAAERAEAERRAIAAKVAAEARRKAEEERAAAEEREMLERARREAEERKAAEERELAERRERAMIEAEARRREAEERERLAAEARAREASEREARERAAMEREAEARRVVEEQRQSEAREAEARAAEERGLLEAKREEEARQLAEKLNRSRAEREAASRAPDRIAGQPERTLIGPPSPLGRSTLESKATVLLVMTPGKRGIRRFEATADPVLCVGMHCYIGAGAGRAARKLPRLAALGPANTLGARAGACRTRLGCIFRGVDLGSAGAELQPVDLRIMRHDRRETQRVAHDSDCGLVGGDLMCRDPIRSATWRAWIVPESLAAAAGPQTLARALASGLPEDRWAAGR